MKARSVGLVTVMGFASARDNVFSTGHEFFENFILWVTTYSARLWRYFRLALNVRGKVSYIYASSGYLSAKWPNFDNNQLPIFTVFRPGPVPLTLKKKKNVIRLHYFFPFKQDDDRILALRLGNSHKTNTPSSILNKLNMTSVLRSTNEVSLKDIFDVQTGLPRHRDDLWQSINN